MNYKGYNCLINVNTQTKGLDDLDSVDQKCCPPSEVQSFSGIDQMSLS